MVVGTVLGAVTVIASNPAACSLTPRMSFPAVAVITPVTPSVEPRETAPVSVVPPVMVSDEPVSHLDIMPTLAELLDEAGLDPSATQIASRSVDGWTCGFPTAIALDGRDAMVAIGILDIFTVVPIMPKIFGQKMG